MADKNDRPITLPKRGGYQGGKPASAMGPPSKAPAAGAIKRQGSSREARECP